MIRQAAFLAVLWLAAPAALADALDGAWCEVGTARELRIDGDMIETPGGNRIVGVYRRHTFEYVVPDGEPGAGGEVFLQQFSDTRMQATLNGGAPMEWTRCVPTA